MANNNGRIYVDRIATPNVGISISDIQFVLANARNDIGALCTYGDINPYAKYKPVEVNSPVPPTEVQLKAINYGITPPVASSSAPDTKNTAWTYTRPVNWFRFLDFDGYDHNSVSPIQGRGDVEVSQASGSESVAVFINRAGSMTLQDYGDLEGYYLCVYLVGSTGDHLPYIKTASAPFSSSMAPSLTLGYDELTPFNNGTEYYLCLCDTMQTELDSPPAGARYLPIPFFRGDSLQNFIGTITKRSGYEVSLVFDYAIGSYSPPAAIHFSAPVPPAPNYFSALPTPDPETGQIENESRYYLDCDQSTSFSLRFRVTAMEDTIYGNSIYARVSPSYYGSPTARKKVNVYKYENSAVSLVTGALSVGTVYIMTLDSDSLVLGTDNQRSGPVPAAITKIRPTITLYDGPGENSVRIGSTTIGIVNGAI